MKENYLIGCSVDYLCGFVNRVVKNFYLIRRMVKIYKKAIFYMGIGLDDPSADGLLPYQIEILCGWRG